MAPHLAKCFCSHSLLTELPAAPYHLEALCHGESAESPGAGAQRPGVAPWPPLERWGGCPAGPLSQGGFTSLRKQSSPSLVISWMEPKKVKANTARPLRSRPRKTSREVGSVMPHRPKRVTGPAGIQRLRKTLPPTGSRAHVDTEGATASRQLSGKINVLSLPISSIPQIHEWR